MIININDPRVSRAVKLVKETHKITDPKEFAKLFEDKYHCTLVYAPNDPFCTAGELHISEDKYSNWFVLQFGE
jgi:hypothetical protein